MEKIKEHEFLLFNKDKIIKTILLDESVIKNNDFHLFERLIKDACGLRIKVIRLLPTELPVQKAIERAKRLDFLVECEGKYVHMEVNTAWEESTKMRNKSYFSLFTHKLLMLEKIMMKRQNLYKFNLIMECQINMDYVKY